MKSNEHYTRQQRRLKNVEKYNFLGTILNDKLDYDEQRIDKILMKIYPDTSSHLANTDLIQRFT
jgi:hypothetical protein